MHRRLALAFSLAFTTIVTFGIVAVGAQVGLFDGGHPHANAQVAASAPTAPPPPSPTAIPPTPIVVTQYDYVDVPDATPTYVAPPPAAPAPTSAAVGESDAASPAASNPATAPTHTDDHEDSPSGGSEEHDD